MAGMPGRYRGYICRWKMRAVLLTASKKTRPDMRVRRTQHEKSDDFSRWVLRKLDLEIKFSPAYPASFF